MLKNLPAAFLGLLLPLLSVPAAACSLMGCVDGGIEVHREFVVLVTHGGRPLQGAKIEITTVSAASIIFS